MSDWMAGGSPLPRIKKTLPDEILKRQRAYRAWVKDILGRPELIPGPGAAHPRLGYRVKLDGFPFPLHIVGFDSAWLAGPGGADASNLRLTRPQALALTEDLEGFRLGLIHHPLGDMKDGEACRPLLAGRIDLLLRGHLHDPSLSLYSDPNAEGLLELAAGCLYEHGTYANACQRIDITLTDEGRPVQFDILFRTWSARGQGFWYDDSSVYHEAKSGHLIWPRLRPVEAPTPPRPESHPGVEPTFVGREPELAQLKEALLPADAPFPVAVGAVQGIPGVGKSYLVDHFAREHEARFPEYIKLALDPTAPRSVEELGVELASKLGLRWEAKEPWGPLREALIARHALVHIENADDEATAAATATLAARLAGAALVISGRCQKIGHAAGWCRIEVGPLDEALALEQLENECRGQLTAAHRAALPQLAKELAYLPLALHLAAGYLRRHSVEGFLKLLRDKRLEMKPADLADPLVIRDPKRAVLGHTFELSLDILRKQCGEEAAAGFAVLGHAPPAGVGRSLGAAMAGLDELAFEELMAEATDLSLATQVPRPGDTGLSWSLHPLLAERLRLTRATDGRCQAGMRDWFLARLRANGDEEPQRWNEVRQEEPALVAWLAQVPVEEAPLVERAGSKYAQRHGPFPAWLGFCDRLLQATADPTTRSNALWTLANMAQSSGDYDWAVRAARDKQRIDKECNAERDAALATGILADILQARGEYDEALRIQREEALLVYERLGDIRSRAVTQGKIADILQARGEYDEALRIHREEELPVYERLGDVRERAVTQGKIADILQARGEYDEALRIRREEERPVYEQMGDVWSRAVTQDKIADILQARGEYDEALRIRREEALPVYERLGDVRSRAVTQSKIADILQVRGEYDEALRIRREEALPVYERLGEVRSRAVTQDKIADIYEARGEYDEALRIHREEALPVYEQLGDVRERAVTQGKIADILQARGEYDEALRIHREEALPVYERLGDVREHAVTQVKIADILQVRGEYDEALRICREEALPVYERLGDVRELLIGRANLALTYLRRGKPEDRPTAAALLRLALVAAEALRIPEAQQIQHVLRKHGLEKEPPP